jgi:hypothetical protein
MPGGNNRARKNMTNTFKSGEKGSDSADSSIVQSKGVSSYKPEEPDTKFPQTLRQLIKYSVFEHCLSKSDCLP